MLALTRLKIAGIDDAEECWYGRCLRMLVLTMLKNAGIDDAEKCWYDAEECWY